MVRQLFKSACVHYLILYEPYPNMAVSDTAHPFRMFMNLAAISLFGVAIGSILMVAFSVYAIVSGSQPSLNLAAIWVAAIWALLAMTAAAWCRMQALRVFTDATLLNIESSDVDVPAALRKGLETWGATNPSAGQVKMSIKK